MQGGDDDGEDANAHCERLPQDTEPPQNNGADSAGAGSADHMAAAVPTESATEAQLSDALPGTLAPAPLLTRAGRTMRAVCPCIYDTARPRINLPCI
jgi:hypothetical protein